MKKLNILFNTFIDNSHIFCAVGLAKNRRLQPAAGSILSAKPFIFCCFYRRHDKRFIALHSCNSAGILCLHFQGKARNNKNDFGIFCRLLIDIHYIGDFCVSNRPDAYINSSCRHQIAGHDCRNFSDNLWHYDNFRKRL